MKKLIIGNWKMNPGTLKEAKKMFRMEKDAAIKTKNIQTIICVPFVYAVPLAAMTRSTKCVVGVQDAFWETEGAFTGEVSFGQLKDLKIKHVILGHSERRKLGETDEMVNKKIKACLAKKIHPIVCIGETERDPSGAYWYTLQEQIEATFAGIQKNDLKNIIITYEPVWAISSTKKRKDAKPLDAHQAVIFIKKVMDKMFHLGNKLPVTMVYGGSANPDNTEAFLTEGGVTGLLPGSASLNPYAFAEMLQIADTIK